MLPASSVAWRVNHQRKLDPLRRRNASRTKAGNRRGFAKNANIPAGFRAVLPDECLPEALHNPMALYCPKLPFPLELPDPQNSKDHNHCQPEEYCSGLIHGSISPQDPYAITGPGVRESY
jgi:hypothetical protein